MVKIQTLNELPRLKDSGFGQPAPRHGLNLLYWFSNRAVEIRNNVLVPKIDIKGKEFGFELFHNRVDDDDDERLLPNEKRPYYEVGNLNAEGADRLPDYVRPRNQRYLGDANMDRIIVRLNNVIMENQNTTIIDQIYITQHSDQLNFSHSATYRVSLGLIRIIRRMERDQFLQEVSWSVLRFQSQSAYVESPQGDSNDSWCTIL